MDTVHLLIYETCIIYNYMTAFITQHALQNMQSALSRTVLHIACPSVRLSPFVRPSVAWVDQSKTVGEDCAISVVIVLHSLLWQQLVLYLALLSCSLCYVKLHVVHVMYYCLGK